MDHNQHWHFHPYQVASTAFDSLLIVSEEAVFTHRGSKPFDHKTVLAYNVVIRAANPNDIWAKAVTLFDNMISEDGEMRDGPPRRFYSARLSG